VTTAARVAPAPHQADRRALPAASANMTAAVTGARVMPGSECRERRSGPDRADGQRLPAATSACSQARQAETY
jgi:hypothetical protein